MNESVMSSEVPKIAAGQEVEVQTAFGNWIPASTLSGIEATHDSEGHLQHDFPVVWVSTDGKNRVPWPVTDVRRPAHSEHDGTVKDKAKLGETPAFHSEHGNRRSL